jgi:hypothetical protein
MEAMWPGNWRVGYRRAPAIVTRQLVRQKRKTQVVIPSDAVFSLDAAADARSVFAFAIIAKNIAHA